MTAFRTVLLRSSLALVTGPVILGAPSVGIASSGPVAASFSVVSRSSVAEVSRLATASPAAPSVASSVASTVAVPGVRRYVTPTGTGQVIVVSAPSWGASSATVTAYERRTDGRWVQKFAAAAARIGRHGMRAATQRREGDGTTPAGSFAVTSTFGRLANPGTRLPYVTVTPYDYWVGDSASRYYNNMRSTVRGGFRLALSEHLQAIRPLYDHAIVVDFNRPGAVPGRGSAIFLHITDGTTTSGCIAVPRSVVVELLRWLDPARHPRIVMGPAAWLAAGG